MQISDDLFEKLASLSRLHFTRGEKEEIKNDLTKMISFIDKLNELDTSAVDGKFYMSRPENVMREDVVISADNTEDALLNAPLHDGNFFKVPKVIKK